MKQVINPNKKGCPTVNLDDICEFFFYGNKVKQDKYLIVKYKKQWMCLTSSEIEKFLILGTESLDISLPDEASLREFCEPLLAKGEEIFQFLTLKEAIDWLYA